MGIALSAGIGCLPPFFGNHSTLPGLPCLHRLCHVQLKAIPHKGSDVLPTSVGVLPRCNT